MTTAAAIIIGDELLSGKTRDTNAPLLIDMLRAAGVTLARLVTIGDDPKDIAEEVRRCAERYDYVITSGGVGPTHDDRTVEGIARAFGKQVVRHPRLENLVREHWGGRLNEAALKLAELPEGAVLLETDDSFLPLAVLRNVYILPGVPQIFVAKLSALRRHLQGGVFVLWSLYLSSDETSIASALGQTAKTFPQVSIGSYPRLGDPDHRVRVTVEGPDDESVTGAIERLLELLPPAIVLRVER